MWEGGKFTPQCTVFCNYVIVIMTYGQVLRREDGHVLRRALDFEVEGRPKWTWKMQAEEESVKVGSRRQDALCQSKWHVDANHIAAGLR